MEASLAALRERIVAARAAGKPLRLRGGGSKDFYGEVLAGEVLDTRGHAGIVDYEPTELVITARCGTPLAQIESVLEEHGQFLAFEPPAFGGEPTIGGVIASGLSGPRRATAGAARDFVLGAHLMTADGNLLRFGGQVMKNVAGFDLSRLLCGSLGILGLVAQVSLKVLPRPRAETTLCFEFDAAAAIAQFNRWCAQPLPVSATAWHGGRAYLRLSGAASAVRAACTMLGGEALAETNAADFWRSLREQSHPVFIDSRRLWRLSLPSNAPLALDGVVLVEWGGALRWSSTMAAAAQVRGAATAAGGTATLWRGARDAPMFHPLGAPLLDLHRKLKQQFDPHGIFNPGRLVAGL